MKKQTFIQLLSICLLALGLSACDVLNLCLQGEGDPVTEMIELDEITGIDLQIQGKVYLTEGSVQSVEVRGQQNLIERLRLDSRVRNGIWHIGFRNTCYQSDEDLEFYITVPKLTHASISGSGAILGGSAFTTDQLEMEISGSGEIELEAVAEKTVLKISGSGEMLATLETREVDASISGSGDVYLQGSAETQQLNISGSGSYRSFQLQTAETSVHITGSGNAEVRVSDQLTVDIDGGGNVYYKGNPSIEVRVSGSGKVIDAN